MAAPAGSSREGTDPIDPLAHPLRRQVLRFMHKTVTPVGALQVAEALEQRVPQVRYHMLTLAKFKVIAEVGVGSDGVSPLYESAVTGNARVLAELERTQEEDEGRQRKAA